MKKAEATLREALATTGMVIPLNSGGRGGKIDFLCRQIPGQETRWLSIVEGLLRWGEQDAKDRLFIARRYLLKDNKMVFGWFLSLERESVKKLDEAAEAMAKYLELLLKETQPELQEAAPAPARQVRQPVARGPVPRIKVIRREVDEDGKVHEETEMPLPHVPKDLNTPSKPVWSETHGRYIGGGKGAKFSSGGR